MSGTTATCNSGRGAVSLPVLLRLPRRPELLRDAEPLDVLTAHATCQTVAIGGSCTAAAGLWRPRSSASRTRSARTASLHRPDLHLRRDVQALRASEPVPVQLHGELRDSRGIAQSRPASALREPASRRSSRHDALRTRTGRTSCNPRPTTSRSRATCRQFRAVPPPGIIGGEVRVRERSAGGRARPEARRVHPHPLAFCVLIGAAEPVLRDAGAGRLRAEGLVLARRSRRSPAPFRAARMRPPHRGTSRPSRTGRSCCLRRRSTRSRVDTRTAVQLIAVLARVRVVAHLARRGVDDAVSANDGRAILVARRRGLSVVARFALLAPPSRRIEGADPGTALQMNGFASKSQTLSFQPWIDWTSPQFSSPFWLFGSPDGPESKVAADGRARGGPAPELGAIVPAPRAFLRGVGGADVELGVAVLLGAKTQVAVLLARVHPDEPHTERDAGIASRRE